MERLVIPSAFSALVLALALTALAWRRWPRLRWALALVSAWCWLGSTPVFENALLARLESRYARPETVAADPTSTVLLLTTGRGVLQNGVGRVRLEGDGWERLAGAVELWHRTGGTLLITGGPPAPESESVALTMARDAVALGVPRDAIAVEPHARNTRENLELARGKVTGAGPVWLVTSALHMPRAMYVARTLGWSVRPWPCDYRAVDHLPWYAWLPNPGVDLGPEAHEILGGLWYRLRR